MTRRDSPNPASFRDPSGCIFFRDGVLHRTVCRSYQKHYDHLMHSGLYQKLVEQNRLVAHEEVDFYDSANVYRVLKPQQVQFISYPYEWSFHQLQDAALLTLDVMSEALKWGMVLKDATAFNVQFDLTRPIFIDTLSFESYNEGEPWVAYRQFCQHFLAPLALVAHVDTRLQALLLKHIDGIPLDLTAKLLPWRTRFNFGLASHIHLHAKMQSRHDDDARRSSARTAKLSKISLLALLDQLRSTVSNLQFSYPKTQWGEYYSDTNYSETAQTHKHDSVKAFLSQVQGKTLLDLGANDGRFSALGLDFGYRVIATDMDPVAIDKLYKRSRSQGLQNILPLVVLLDNPTPALGWQHDERASFAERFKCDVVMALALIHHLAIGNNVPLAKIAEFFSTLGHHLIIEFVPKSDSQVQRMLATREDVFAEYSAEGFENAFGNFFQIVEKLQIEDSERSIYLFMKK